MTIYLYSDRIADRISMGVKGWGNIEQLQNIADASSPGPSYHPNKGEYDFSYIMPLERRLEEAEVHYHQNDFQELLNRLDSDEQISSDRVDERLVISTRP